MQPVSSALEVQPMPQARENMHPLANAGKPKSVTFGLENASTVELKSYVKLRKSQQRKA